MLAYVDGRFFFPLRILPSALVGGLIYLLFLGYYVIKSFSKDSRSLVRVKRCLFAGLSFLVISLPNFVDDGYYEMGLRDHVKSLFSPKLIADVKQRVRAFAEIPENAQRREPRSPGAEDLPSEVAASAWGFPGHVSYTIQGPEEPLTISLTWGGGLIGHHGLLITNEEIPSKGYPSHGGDDNDEAHDFERFNPFERYYPLGEGAYIFIDEN
ncbi:hypothetical protein BGE01nite_21540 [Brevifollis gellanilyticus]|uniref:Uncharacterized protein n=1 Tax=Brevifollis gellanilyticus TaxID=748831 RepID=A0A512M804_9BACT|nr:hypothetical protein BGE01nite_21540 [Brevifollis gellanilyticus]